MFFKIGYYDAFSKKYMTKEFYSVSKNHILGMYVYVMDAYTI